MHGGDITRNQHNLSIQAGNVWSHHQNTGSNPGDDYSITKSGILPAGSISQVNSATLDLHFVRWILTGV